MAIFILAIVLTAVLGSFNAVFIKAGVIESSGYDFEMAKTCLNRMIDDLMSIHVTLPPAYTPPDMDGPFDPYRVESELTGGAELSMLRFTSLAHLMLNRDPRRGVAEIVYYTTESDDGRIVLRRADSLYPYETDEERAGDPVLCEKIKSLKFTFYDDEGETHDTWNSEDEAFGYATPLSVGIEVTFSDDTAVPMQQTLVKLPLHRSKRP